MTAPSRTRSLLFASLVLALLGGLSGCGGADARRASHMARGQEYFAKEQWDKARVEFADALQIAPNDAQARFMSGQVAERLGNLRGALSMYQGAMDVNPDHVQARTGLARLYAFGGAPAKALELVEPGLAKHPDDPGLLTVRATARAQMRDRAGALADAERAVQLAPADENAVSVLAGLYVQQQNPRRAIEVISAALTKLPDSVELRLVLTRLYVASGDNNLAEGQLQRVVQMRPKQLQLRLSLAGFYIDAHRLDDAERTLREAVAAMPASDDAKMYYAEFLAEHRTVADGESVLKAAIAKDPRNFDLQLGLAGLQLRSGARQDAIATYRAVIDSDPEGPHGVSARDRLAMIETTAGHYEAALTLLAAALKINPRDADALTMRGNIALQRGNLTGAIADLRAVLRDKPQDVAVLRTLARAHLQNLEPALAEENLRAALSAAPENVGVRVDLGEFLTHTKRANEAIKVLEDTVRAVPGSAGTTARMALVNAYLSKPDLPAARTAAEDLKTLRPDLAIGAYQAGLVAEQQKRPEDAQREFEHALQLQPGAFDALTALAHLEFARGQRSAAIARVHSAVEAAPQDTAARNLLGELYLGDGSYAQAAAEFNEAIRMAPKWWVPYRNLVLAKSAAKDTDGALAALQAGVAATQEPLLVVDLASVYESKGRIDDAVRFYEALHERQPHLQLAANNLAMLLVTYRKDQASLDRARDLTAGFANSDVASLLDTHGWVLLKRGEVSQALAALEKAARESPDSRQIRYHLGMAQLKAGQPDRARVTLESALSGGAAFAGTNEARLALAQLKAQTG